MTTTSKTAAADRTYPFFVLRLGQPAKDLYDAVYDALTAEPDALTPEVAEFMIRQDWDEMWSHYDSSGN